MLKYYKMGGSSSKSEAESIVNDYTSYFNSVLNTCTATTDASNIVNIDNLVSGGNITISNIGQKITAVASASCVQKTITSNTITNQISQTAKAKTTAVESAFQLGSSHASTITKLINNIGTETQNIYANDCSSSAAGSNTVNIGICPNGNSTKTGSCPSGSAIVAAGNIVITGISQQDTLNAIASCTQETMINNSAVNDLINYIDQNTSAKGKGPLSSLFGGLFSGISAIIQIIIIIVIIVVFLAIIGVVIFVIFKFIHKKKPATNPLIMNPQLIPPPILPPPPRVIGPPPPRVIGPP